MNFMSSREKFLDQRPTHCAFTAQNEYFGQAFHLAYGESALSDKPIAQVRADRSAQYRLIASSCLFQICPHNAA